MFPPKSRQRHSCRQVPSFAAQDAVVSGDHCNSGTSYAEELDDFPHVDFSAVQKELFPAERVTNYSCRDKTKESGETATNNPITLQSMVRANLKKQISPFDGGESSPRLPPPKRDTKHIIQEALLTASHEQDDFNISAPQLSLEKSSGTSHDIASHSNKIARPERKDRHSCRGPRTIPLLDDQSSHKHVTHRHHPDRETSRHARRRRTSDKQYGESKPTSHRKKMQSINARDDGIEDETIHSSCPSLASITNDSSSISESISHSSRHSISRKQNGSLQKTNDTTSKNKKITSSSRANDRFEAARAFSSSMRHVERESKSAHIRSVPSVETHVNKLQQRSPQASGAKKGRRSSISGRNQKTTSSQEGGISSERKSRSRSLIGVKASNSTHGDRRSSTNTIGATTDKKEHSHPIQEREQKASLCENPIQMVPAGPEHQHQHAHQPQTSRQRKHHQHHRHHKSTPAGKAATVLDMRRRRASTSHSMLVHAVHASIASSSTVLPQQGLHPSEDSATRESRLSSPRPTTTERREVWEKRAATSRLLAEKAKPNVTPTHS